VLRLRQNRSEIGIIGYRVVDLPPLSHELGTPTMSRNSGGISRLLATVAGSLSNCRFASGTTARSTWDRHGKVDETAENFRLAIVGRFLPQ
jgi:hypothetical protein